MRTFRTKLLLGAAAALALSATSAQAAIELGSSIAGPDTGAPAGYTVVLNYDGIDTGFFATSGGTVANDSLSGIRAVPFGTTPGTNYAYIGAGGVYTLSAAAITGFSFYLGSIDTFNSISFFGAGGLLRTFTGSELAPPADGDQTAPATNRRLTFNFNGDVATSIQFNTSDDAMEWDTIAVPTAVPEPATWAMMITGFGLMGAALRRRRRTAAAVTA